MYFRSLLLQVALFVCLMTLMYVCQASAQDATASQRLFTYDPGPALESFERQNFVAGKEVVYLDSDLKTGSFSPDAEHNRKFDIYYTCPVCHCLLRIPKKCSCGRLMVPCVRIQSGWYAVHRELNGRITIGEELYQVTKPQTISASSKKRVAGGRRRAGAKKSAHKRSAKNEKAAITSDEQVKNQ